MDQCLIHSDAHHSEDPYHRREGQIVSGQCKDDDRSSDGKKDTGHDDDGIFDIIELQDQHEDHQDKSDEHSLSEILRTLCLRSDISSARFLESSRKRMIFDDLIYRQRDITQSGTIFLICLDRDIPFTVFSRDSIDLRLQLLFADDLIQRDLPYFRLFYRHISREECIQ
jgi:hypothetical protein